MISEEFTLLALTVGLGSFLLSDFIARLSKFEKFLFWIVLISGVATGLIFLFEYFSVWGREKQKRLGLISEIPESLLSGSEQGVKLGDEIDLLVPIYLPDSIRRRHVHILGATGSGKTESVILNMLRQDVSRGIGAIVLDAKGDTTFAASLKEWVPSEQLQIFDLGSEDSLTYSPLAEGSPIEAAQRLFSSLNWSEEYYKSKAFSALQKLFQIHFETNGKNPTFLELSRYLEDPESYAAVTLSGTYPPKLAERDFMDLSGLRDQVNTLCMGHLSRTLSPDGIGDITLSQAKGGKVIYFRLQSLLSPQLVTSLGKLLIQHLNYLAGTAHRGAAANGATLIPTYLDEFASFACPEFADLISKARSAGLALHFSHQSIGDLAEVSKGFLNRITDNSATKIVLRINDPDSAEFFARSFGTKLYQKITQRITNAKERDTAEVLEEGSQREAHQFRAAPDLLKTLPTGVGSVLIAHGYKTPHGASTVFKIQFPKLEKEERNNEK